MDGPDVTIDLFRHEYLPNGALILLETDRQTGAGMSPQTTVLAKTERDFVTWQHVFPENGSDFCVAGHYHGHNLRRALDDYERRSR